MPTSLTIDEPLSIHGDSEKSQPAAAKRTFGAHTPNSTRSTPMPSALSARAPASVEASVLSAMLISRTGSATFSPQFDEMSVRWGPLYNAFVRLKGCKAPLPCSRLLGRDPDVVILQGERLLRANQRVSAGQDHYCSSTASVLPTFVSSLRNLSTQSAPPPRNIPTASTQRLRQRELSLNATPIALFRIKSRDVPKSDVHGRP